MLGLKASPPCWLGQKEDICPSIKKSMSKYIGKYTSPNFIIKFKRMKNTILTVVLAFQDFAKYASGVLVC